MKQVLFRFRNYKQIKMAGQMVDYIRREKREEGAELIDFKQGILDCEVKMLKPLHDLSWLKQQSQNYIAKKELPPPPPPKKKKQNRSEFEKRIISQRTTGKGFVQNCQIGKANKKVWDLDMAFIRNIFAYLNVVKSYSN